MIQNVQTTELALTINAWIHVPCMIHVAKMQSVRPEAIDQYAGAPMVGQEILTQNVTHVGSIKLGYLFKGANLFAFQFS